MSINLSTAYAYIQDLEKTALASADPDIQALGASATNALAAFGELLNKARAVAPKAVALIVDTGISGLTKVEPVFGFLIPMEGVAINPLVEMLSGNLENLILGKVTTPAFAPEPQPDPS